MGGKLFVPGAVLPWSAHGGGAMVLYFRPTS